MIDATDFTIEQLGAADFGPCPCCGGRTHRVWGWAHRAGTTEASYFVEWVPGAVHQHGAHFDFIVGAWGEGSSAAERAALTLAFRHTSDGPAFMVIDAEGRAHARSELVGRVLHPEEVLAGPFAIHAFAIADAIWLQDERIQELRDPAA